MRSLTTGVLTITLTLAAACSGPEEDAAHRRADALEAQGEAQADSLERRADAAPTRAQKEALNKQADAVEDAAEAKADAIEKEIDRKY